LTAWGKTFSEKVSAEKPNGGLLVMKIRPILAAGFVAVSGQGAMAASDVSNSGAQSNTATATVAASTAASQTSAILSGAATGGFSFGVGGSGGFTGGGTGGSGGFGTGGSGGFGTGGSGGFGPGGSGSPGGSGGSGGSGGFDNGGGRSGGGSSSLPSGKFSTRAMGAAGGGEESDTGLWGQVLWAHIDKTEQFLEMKGQVGNGLIGIDHRIAQRYLLGLAAGYEAVDIDTDFNHGTYKSGGFTLAPYAAINLTPAWVLDASVAYSWLNYDTTRNWGAATASFSGYRVMGNTNLTGAYAVGNWRFQPRLSLLYSSEHQNNHRESDGSEVGNISVRLGRLSAGSKVGYDLGDGIVPYAKVIGEWDFLRPGAVAKTGSLMSNVDDGGAVGGLGVEVNRGGITGSVEVDNNSMFRKELDVWAVIARLRWDM